MPIVAPELFQQRSPFSGISDILFIQIGRGQIVYTSVNLYICFYMYICVQTQQKYLTVWFFSLNEMDSQP